MAKQRIYYTTLPNGVNPSNGKHRFSVFVTPRLEPETQTLLRGSRSGQLGDYPDWVDWPQTVRDRIDWSFGVTAGGEDFEPEVTITSPTPSSDAWTELCPPDSLLEDFPGPLPRPFSDSYVVSHPDELIEDYLINTLAGLAGNPDEPDIDAVREAYSAIDFYDPARDDLDLDAQLAEIVDQLAETGTVRSDPNRPDLDIVQGLLLNEPTLENLRAACEAVRAGAAAQTRAGQIRGGAPPPTDPPEAPNLDFHQAAAAATGHPFLLRLLGLVVDFEWTPPPQFLGTQPTEVLVYVTVDLDSQLPSSDIVPTPQLWTRSLIGATVFEAADPEPRPTTERGLLRLADPLGGGGPLASYPKYALTQTDPQGAALKTVEFMKNVAKLKLPEKSSPFAPTEQPPPSLRAGGISVTQLDRAKSVAASYKRQVALNKRMLNTSPSAQPIILEREDITRGYAFDVFDSVSSRWYSLCERVGRARFGDAADDPRPEPLPGDVNWEDEGWVSGAITEGVSPQDTVQRVTNTFASWANGWSMVTARPGKSVDPDEKPVERAPEIGDFKLAVRYAAKPGSLPPQRFGRTYRLRGRAVDLAGNAISSDEASALDSPHVLETPYARFEPVAAPTIIMRKRVTEGESPDLVVIRSNFGTAPAGTGPSDRHIFPPPYDEFRSECHGMFDDANGISPGRYAQIAARESGAYDERDESGNFIHPNAEPDPLNYGAPYFDVDTPQFLVEGGSLARMPSLPDPMSRGFTFVGLPGAQAGTAQIYDIYRGGATWPNIRPIRLRVFESASFVPPALVGDELRVGLPKGESFEVSLRSPLVASRADHMALLDLIPPSLRQRTIDGRHWAVSPQRKLRLVHAVRQPLLAAEFSDTGPFLTRRAGETAVRLEDTMTISRKSTERVEVYADWVEKTDYLPPGVDELHEPGRWEPEREVPVAAKVFERPIDFEGPEDELPVDERHELHTTRHIPGIAYRTIATTRFKEYFTERAEVTLTEGSPTALLPTAYTGPAAPTSQGVVEDSERVTSLDGTQTFERNQVGEEDGFYEMDYEAGTITRFDVSERNNMPEQVRVTYIKREITRETEPRIRKALSGRRPDPPKVQYAMPTFKRTTDFQNNTSSAQREATGLRIFLDRPWWSSGDGELLGVVLAEPATPSSMDHLISRRGKDPIWEGDAARDRLSGIEFPASVNGRDGVSVPGASSGQTLRVEGHRVKPDDEHLRWYCDVDIDNASGDPYTPFVRLALARYQPDSIFGLEASGVVLLDFMQLYPDRYASVYRFNESTAEVFVSGTSYDGGRSRRTSAARVPRGSVIVAQAERRRVGMGIRDDLFAWIPVPGQGPVELSFDQDGENAVPNWSGSVDVSQAERVTIREYEQFGPMVDGKYQRRLVYAEAIPVPPFIDDL